MSFEAVSTAYDEVCFRTGTAPAEIRVSTRRATGRRDVATVTPDAWWAAVRECLIMWGWWGRDPEDKLVDCYAVRDDWRFKGVPVVV